MKYYVLKLDYLASFISCFDSDKNLVLDFSDSRGKVFESLTNAGDKIILYFNYPKNNVFIILSFKGKIDNNYNFEKLLEIKTNFDSKKLDLPITEESVLCEITEEKFSVILNELIKNFSFENYNINDKLAVNYTLDELSSILIRYYNSMPPKPTGIHYFGFMYSSYLDEKGIKSSDIIKKSELPKSYEKELDKGKNLAKYIKKNNKFNEIVDVNSNIFEAYEEWLHSYDNPDYTGKEKYRDYKKGIVKLLNEMQNLNLIDSYSLEEMDVDYYRNLEKIYDNNLEIKEFDHLKNSDYCGIASLRKYINYIKFLNDNHDIESDNSSSENLFTKSNYIFTTLGDGINRIVYGTPGCGKSYYLEHTLLENYDKDHNVIRTTFYQDYTNTDFVGQILPIVEEDKSVTYKFVPGPFTLALNRAIQNPNDKVALVIEELNRGNAPSIFGDIFQLLDRKEGLSEYKITNVGIQGYLEEENPSYKFDHIKIPGNLSIFATMNTSDQNVFTLDTAFKRRWKFHKIKNTFDDHPFRNKFVPGLDIDWECFCNAINDAIIEDENFINSEDKQLGVYFVDENTLRTNKEDVSTPEARKEFAYKVLEYLWDDVAKFSHKEWFGDIKSLDNLIEAYEENGKTIFKKVKFEEDKNK